MNRKNLRVCGIASLVLVAVLLCFYITSAKAILSHSQQFTLYSLDPQIRANLPGKEVFHKYSALGKVEIKDAKVQARLIDSFYRAINTGERAGAEAACFMPRHGIRAEWLGQTVDVVICFQCMQVDFYKSGGKQHLLIDPSPKADFNRALSNAGVPLSKKWLGP